MTSKKSTIRVTAFLLAIGGAFCTKASNNVKFTEGFTFNGTAASSLDSCTSNAANQPCRTSSFPNGRILYTAAAKKIDLSISTLRTIH